MTGTNEEAIKREAERIRSLPDKQLVEEFHRSGDTQMGRTATETAQKDTKNDTARKSAGSLEKFLRELSEGKCKGIKGGTVYKIQQYAKERGFI